MIEDVSNGLKEGHSPVKASDGTGGAYFMPGSGSSGKNYVGVFKPLDEEPGAENNPNGLALSPDGEGLKKGTKVGQGALREVGAYLLDHPRGPLFSEEERGFSGVPPTTMIECTHPGFHHPQGIKCKVGSLQKFSQNEGSCEDVGPGNFPVEEVHKIAVLDIRLANAERHVGNILRSRDENGNIVLVPIDHGYYLPESFEDCTFEWRYWSQAREPYSRDTLDYIRSLNADEDISLLEFNGWKISLEAARTLRLSTMLLKKGAEKGLTAFDIASMMCRETIYSSVK